ncbi:MAG: hypothetical protein HY648_06270 [Acidobacteria bacterium]|nr:hypothetical protein [Acidobacteriota bacterium]
MTGQQEQHGDENNVLNNTDLTEPIKTQASQKDTGLNLENPPQKKEPSKPFWLWRRKSLSFLEMLLKVGINVGTVGILVLMAMQWKTMVNQQKTMQDQLTEFRNSIRVDQRAWVGPRDVIRPDLKEATPLLFGVNVLNSGNSPALKVKAQTSRSLLPASTAFEPTFRSVEGPESLTVIQPGMPAQLWAPPVEFTRQQLDAIISGEYIFYAYGHITYEDIFGASHQTKFCMFLKTDMTGMSSCTIYNDAD